MRPRAKELAAAQITRDYQLVLAKLAADAEANEKRWVQQKADIARQAEKSAANRDLARLDGEQILATQQAELELRIQTLTAEADSLVKRAEAISPDLVAALQAFGNQMVASEAAKAMAPLAILGGSSVADVLKQLLSGTQMGKAMAAGLEGRLPTGETRNGSSSRA